MSSLVWDLESDGLLDSITKIHCIAILNLDLAIKKPVLYVGEQEVKYAIEELQDADLLIGQNISGFDINAIEKVTGIRLTNKIYDTVIAARMIFPNIPAAYYKDPETGKVLCEKGHSLKAWGMRLGLHKIQLETDWKEYTDEMGIYCARDVEVTYELYKHLIAQNWPQSSIDAEMLVAPIISNIGNYGIYFDVPEAEKLYAELLEKRMVIAEAAQKVFPPWYRFKSMFTPKSTSNNYTPGAELCRIELIQFNPAARGHIIDRLINKYNWKPETYTDKGNTVLNESVLDSLPYPEAKALVELFKLDKLIGQLATGDNAWLRLVEADGRIHGFINQNGATTGRCSHACVPMESQILTRRGWVSYDDAIVGEEVLALDTETHTKKWTPLLAKNKYHDSEVGYLRLGRRKIRCTANHKWYIKTKASRVHNGLYMFKEADKLGMSDRVVFNAPYDNTQEDSKFDIIQQKYDINLFPYMTKMSHSELASFIYGFLLADGCFMKSTNGWRDSWSFAQAEGHLLEVLRTAVYIHTDKRISSGLKQQPLKNQRKGYQVRITQCSTLGNRRSGWSETLNDFEAGMKWVKTSREDVWCPTTKYGTWVMKQGDEILITGNSPNLSQVPKDERCRKLFRAAPGKVLVGCDFTGLEYAVLAGYVSKYDGGIMAHQVEVADKSKGTDVHTLNGKLLGVDRETAKTALYGIMYGAGDLRTGEIAAPDESEAKQRRIGKDLRERVLDNLIGLKELITDLKAAYRPRAKEQDGKNGYKEWVDGWVRGLDGRQVPCEYDYKALNYLIQSAGAFITKRGLVELVKLLEAEGLTQNKSYGIVVYSHDEVDLECDPKDKEIIKQAALKACELAGEFYKFPCKMSGEVKEGLTWWDIH